MDRLSREQRRRNMQAVKSKGSKIEKTIAKALFSLGYRYRKNDITVFGKPDLTFRKIKLAIFIDGEFWHGKDWVETKYNHKSNIEFWHKKIESNIRRDNEVNLALNLEGWKVLRFWGKQVEKNMDICIEEIVKAVDEQRHKINAIHKNT